MRENLVKKISVPLLLVAVLAGLAFGAMSLLRSAPRTQVATAQPGPSPQHRCRRAVS